MRILGFLLGKKANNKNLRITEIFAILFVKILSCNLDGLFFLLFQHSTIKRKLITRLNAFHHCTLIPFCRLFSMHCAVVWLLFYSIWLYLTRNCWRYYSFGTATKKKWKFRLKCFWLLMAEKIRDRSSSTLTLYFLLFSFDNFLLSPTFGPSWFSSIFSFMCDLAS